MSQTWTSALFAPHWIQVIPNFPVHWGHRRKIKFSAPFDTDVALSIHFFCFYERFSPQLMKSLLNVDFLAILTIRRNQGTLFPLPAQPFACIFTFCLLKSGCDHRVQSCQSSTFATAWEKLGGKNKKKYQIKFKINKIKKSWNAQALPRRTLINIQSLFLCCWGFTSQKLQGVNQDFLCWKQESKSLWKPEGGDGAYGKVFCIDSHPQSLHLLEILLTL